MRKLQENNSFNSIPFVLLIPKSSYKQEKHLYTITKQCQPKFNLIRKQISGKFPDKLMIL